MQTGNCLIVCLVYKYKVKSNSVFPSAVYEHGCYVCVEQGFTATQLQLVEDNAQLTLQREKEISQIVKSIHDLNEIFKDLASMVVDQVNYFRVLLFLYFVTNM
jgi:hypothetical protein